MNKDIPVLTTTKTGTMEEIVSLSALKENEQITCKITERILSELVEKLNQSQVHKM